MNNHLDKELIQTELEAIKHSFDLVLRELQHDDPFPFCLMGGCEGVSSDCHKKCKNSTTYIAKILVVADIDNKLREHLSHNEYQDLRRKLGYGLGNRVDVRDQDVRAFMSEDRVYLNGHHNVYEIYDIYDFNNNRVCQALCIDISHQTDNKGKILYDSYVSTFIPITKLEKLV